MSTMKDVANLAGVSVATVSRYINRSGYVSVSAKTKIELAIKDLEYTPNEVARALFQKRSKFVGVLLPDITNPFFTLLAKGMEDRLNESDYTMLLCNTQNNSEKIDNYLNIFDRNNVAGIISASSISPIISKSLPFVAIDRFDGSEPSVVYSDDFQGGVKAAEAIIKGKGKNILILSGPDNLYKSKERLDGMLSVLRNYDVALTIRQTSSFLLEGIDPLMDDISQLLHKVDSIIATNDLHALKILKMAVKMNIEVPDELQIVGYDNIAFSNLSILGLSTISQPIYEMGKRGSELLLNYLNNDHVEKSKIKLPVELIERETNRK